jgi:hypothetical protein
MGISNNKAGLENLNNTNTLELVVKIEKLN